MSVNVTNQKKSIDILRGSIWKGIFQFALPVAATAVLGQLFNAADVAIVGSFTGEDVRNIAVAAVGANSPIVGLIVNLFIGIALGATVVIANAIGRRDAKAVRRTVHTAIVFSVLGGMAVAVLGELIAGPLLNWLSVPPDVFPSALLYLRIYIVGLPAIFLYNFEAAIFRSIGETKIPLIALTASGVLNVVLNLFFVITLKMTVDGVAIATVVSNAVSAVILYGYLRKTTSEVHIDRRLMTIDNSSLKRMLEIGVPAGAQGAVFAISNIVIQAAINSLGTVVMAASTAAFLIEVISYNVMNSFSQACTTFVGQNFGAHNLLRCKKVLGISILEGLLTFGLTSALIFLFDRQLLAIFNSDPEVIEIGRIRLYIITLSLVFSLFYEAIGGYLRGCGISMAPAILTVFGVCVVRIAWIQFVFQQSRTFTTIMIGYPVSLMTTTLLLVFALIYYRPVFRYKRNYAARIKELSLSQAK